MSGDIPIRDIHLPESISWWPIAPGWWLLLLLSLFFGLLTLQKIRRRNNKAHRDAISQQDTIANAQKILKGMSKTLDDQQAIKEVSVLLRRTAMSLYGRDSIAGLTGAEWLMFLDKKGKTTDFSQGSGQVLIKQPYQETTHYNRKKLVAITSQWLQTQLQIHPVEEAPKKSGDHHV